MFKKLIQVGFVSREPGRILDNYINIYNISPWYILKFCPENVKSMTVYGKKQEYAMNVFVCPIADVRFEYIEPITKSVFSDFHDQFSENAVHHLKFTVSNYRETLNFFASRNIELIQSGHQCGDAGQNIYNFFDTRKELGFITEIVHVTKNFIKPRPDCWLPSELNNLEPVLGNTTVVGIVVENIKDKIRKYEEFKIGPWQILDFGKESNLKVKTRMAFCRLDNVILKLIEPQSDSIFSEFLLKQGEGIHHLKLEVADYDKTLKYLQTKGISSIYSDSYLDKIRFSFLNTGSQLNFVLEISDKEIKNVLQSDITVHP